MRAGRSALREKEINVDSGARVDAREGARRVGSEDEQGREHRGEQAVGHLEDGKSTLIQVAPRLAPKVAPVMVLAGPRAGATFGGRQRGRSPGRNQR